MARVALVTGGTRGIGRAIAEALLSRAFTVVVCGRNQTGIDQAVAAMKTAHGDRISGTVCDVGRYDQVQSMMQDVAQRFGGLDLLVNNAGIGNFSSVENMTPEIWRSTIDTNLTGLFYCCHEAIPLMKKRGGGYIINIGSLAGRNFFPGGSAYGASKAGLIAFSESLMQEVRYEHIRVSYIMPGSVETKSNLLKGSAGISSSHRRNQSGTRCGYF
jgi:NAD(P)-dependent dehydrogenase (short-subunit alcohol dehydrogenase family)